jgi:hypothetical protein
MMWFPDAYLNNYIKWEPVDANSAKATMTVNGTTASAILKFDGDGKLVDFIAERYMETTKETWSTPVAGYKDFNGMMLPSGGKAVWKLKSGDFCYIELELVDIEYNTPEEY